MNRRATKQPRMQQLLGCTLLFRYVTHMRSCVMALSLWVRCERVNTACPSLCVPFSMTTKSHNCWVLNAALSTAYSAYALARRPSPNLLFASTQVYAAVLARMLGSYMESAENVPRACRNEFRRPRYVVYKMQLWQRMAMLRGWWMVRALLSLLHAYSLLQSVQWCGVDAVTGCVAAIMPETHTSLTAAPLDTWWWISYVSSTVILPLLLGAFASYSLCAWSARDFSGRMSKKQSLWVWPPGSIGIHPGQTLAHRLPKPDALLSTLPPSRSRRAGSPVTRDSTRVGQGSVGAPSPLTTYLAPSPTAFPSPMATARPHLDAGASATKSSIHLDTEVGVLSIPRKYPDSTRLVAPKPLRIVILTIGTRGDVQPYIALGLAMKEAGHTVVISTTTDFREMVLSYGLEFADTDVPRITQPTSWLGVTSVADMMRATAPNIIGPYPKVAEAFYHACREPVSQSMRVYLKVSCVCVCVCFNHRAKRLIRTGV